MRYPSVVFTAILLGLFGSQNIMATGTIIHDGEFEFLRQQYGDKWDA